MSLPFTWYIRIFDLLWIDFIQRERERTECVSCKICISNQIILKSIGHSQLRNVEVYWNQKIPVSYANPWVSIVKLNKIQRYSNYVRVQCIWKICRMQIGAKKMFQFILECWFLLLCTKSPSHYIRYSKSIRVIPLNRNKFTCVCVCAKCIMHMCVNISSNTDGRKWR